MKELMQCYYPEIDDAMMEQFDLFYHLLVEWNEKFNLTAITDYKEVFIKHFLDSISAQKYIKKNALVLDIGAGAGFPSVPLSIIRDDLKFVLVDSLRKRVDFLEEVKSTLRLGYMARHDRIEDLGLKNTFDCAVSRAVASLPTLLEYALPHLKLGGTFIAYKSQNVPEEIVSARNALAILGGQIKESPSFLLPGTNIMRTLIVVKKIANTPGMYPRGQNKPKNMPL